MTKYPESRVAPFNTPTGSGAVCIGFLLIFLCKISSGNAFEPGTGSMHNRSEFVEVLWIDNRRAYHGPKTALELCRNHTNCNTILDRIAGQRNPKTNTHYSVLYSAWDTITATMFRVLPAYGYWMCSLSFVPREPATLSDTPLTILTEASTRGATLVFPRSKSDPQIFSGWLITVQKSSKSLLHPFQSIIKTSMSPRAFDVLHGDIENAAPACRQDLINN